MNKLTLVILFAFLIFAQASLAADFTAEAQVAGSYLAGRDAVIDLVITNNGPTEWFSISVIGIPSDWLQPATSSGLFKVEGGKSGTLPITVSPGKDAIPLTYEYFINVKNTRTGESIEERILISVKQVTDVIITDFEISCQECNKQVEVSGALNNIGTRDIPVVMTLTFGDDIRTLELPELKVLEQEPFTEIYDIKDLEPAAYQIEAKVMSNTKTLYEDTLDFIIPRVQKITSQEKSYNTPFGRFVSIDVLNDGNYKTDAEIKSNVSSAWYIIYSGPDSRVEGPEYNWIVNVEPGKVYELGYSEIYWPTYLIVFIIILVGFMLYRNYTALTVEKAIVGKNLVVHGNDLSVSITVRNKVRNINNLIVKDVIPAGFALVTKFATVKPILRKVHNGTEVVWKIGELKPYEQRVLHYKMKPVKAFRGRMHLEKAALLARHGEKTIRRNSNLVTVYSQGKQPSFIPVEISK